MQEPTRSIRLWRLLAGHTRELKMEVDLYPFYAGGILKWSVGDP